MPSVSNGFEGRPVGPKLAALLGYVQGCERALLFDPQQPLVSQSGGNPSRWSAPALMAHNADFRREQLERLRAVAAGVEPPEFPAVNHADPAMLACLEGRHREEIGSDLETITPALVEALTALDDEILTDGSRFPWMRGRALWAQILVRGAWHPLGHLTPYLVAEGRAGDALSLVRGVIGTAEALGVPAAPGGVAMAVYVLAATHALAGDREEALARLARVLAADPALARNATRDPDFDLLRDDPEFAALTG
jgi:hypothetical protein